MKALAVATLTAVLVAAMYGCGARQRPTEEPSGEKSIPKTSPPGRTNEATDPGPTGGGFVAASESSGGTAGAADRIQSVRFEVFEGYERVIIAFGGRGASGVPAWSLDSPSEGGYVRINFPGVSSTATGGKDLVGLVMDEIYVVRAPEEGFFADVFGLAQPGRTRRLALHPGAGRQALM